jgi:uncharacterized membrane protein YfcA
MPTRVLAKTLGVFVIAFGIYQLLPLPPARGSRIAATYCGILGGLLGTLFGTGGPFYAIYLNLRALDRNAFRATFALNFLIDGGVRLFAYAVLGLLHGETLLHIAAAAPIAAAGLFAGGRLQTGLNQRTFVRIIGMLLLGGGIALLLR